MMKDLRMWLGKHGTKNTKTLLERCAVQLTELKRTRATMRRNYMGGANEKTNSREDFDVEIDIIFCEAFVYAVDCNFFGKGPPQHIKPGPSAKRDVTKAKPFVAGEEGFSRVGDSKILLNKELLKIFSVGEARTCEYFERFAKNESFHTSSSRPESNEEGKDGVSLKTIQPLKDAAEKDMKMKIKRSTSIKYEELNKAYTIPEVKDDLQALYDKYQQEYDNGIDFELFGPQKRDNKGNLINKLIMLRNMIKRKDEKWKETTEALVKENLREAQDSATITEITHKELENPFYNLIYGAKSVDINQKYTFDCPEADPSSDSSADDNMSIDLEYDDEAPNTHARESIGMGVSNFGASWRHTLR